MQPQKDYSHIQGWGADLDHANRPAYPKERTPPRLEGVHWDQPVPQHSSVEVFHSTERADMTPVYGTTVPPSGLSGRLRRYAFRYSENDIRHWLLLLFADRINMFEGVGADLRHGKVPNVFAEMGGRAAFKYNRKATVRKMVVLSAVAGLGVYWLMRRRRR
ncbi:uncharacterized protein NMK_0127 [Novimethylophilus kurashikiensis]|uniref:Uncharacterized protein n=1 Tax=Novimethylophilus kurashikiensis TaxID=1825523 RepID=A0A2R5F1N0_9PROT|nr:hypothetical protein [Novimethylophilus kurashikiensis]GBG12596.1 uncharacterized protein NMK_0127 [Novimethylophilus kurashikiensis]